MPAKMTVTFLCMQCGKYPRLVIGGRQLRVCLHCGYHNLMKALFDPELGKEEEDHES